MSEQFTLKELITCARREVTLRRRVYPGWIASRRIAPQTAEKQIAMMEAIAERLERLEAVAMFPKSGGRT